MCSVNSTVYVTHCNQTWHHHSDPAEPSKKYIRRAEQPGVSGDEDHDGSEGLTQMWAVRSLPGGLELWRTGKAFIYSSYTVLAFYFAQDFVWAGHGWMAKALDFGF